MGVEEYKTVTQETYNSVAFEYGRRDSQTDVPERLDTLSALDRFIGLVKPRGGLVLDIGSGGGRDTRYFHDHSIGVIGIDNSPVMLDIAHSTNSSIPYAQMDMEALGFAPESFSGIWANASLHHMPKTNLPAVLNQVHELLEPGGFFFMKVKHGSGEGMHTNEKFGKEVERYFAFYSNDEVRDNLLEAGFDVWFNINTTHNEWVDALARKHGA